MNVKIVAGLPGLTTGYGGTHQAIEDLALMRMVPGLVVIDPCDATEIAQATARHRGPSTARSTCGCCAATCRSCSTRRPTGSRSARPVRLREGSDVGIMSTGFMTERALDAADRAGAAGIIAPACCTCRRIKPFDAEAVAAFAASVGRLVTAENHVVVGGLASLVAETPVRRRRGPAAAPHRAAGPFIECGAVPTLQERYGITTEGMVAAGLGNPAPCGPTLLPLGEKVRAEGWMRGRGENAFGANPSSPAAQPS